MNKHYKEAIQTEVDAAYLYKKVADLQEDPQLKDFYLKMSKIEAGHRDKINKEIVKQLPGFVIPGPSLRARIISWLGAKFGQNLMLGSLMDTEKAVAKASIVQKKKAGETITGNESRHVEILGSIQRMSGANIGKVEGRHRSVGGNALRAAVLGANDGLVSNMSLVMGVAGAMSEGNAVLVAGSAGLLAGAISMSLGEWISVKSSQELYERQIELEEAEIELNPEEERRELELLYRAKGMSEKEAQNLSHEVISDPSKAREILVKEELNIDMDELEGSAWEAAIASFFLFVVGAIIPLFPFFFATGYQAIIYSVISSTIGLFVIGAGITLITGRSIWYSGIRQVVFGLAAAAVTFGIGKLIGVSI